MREKTRTQKFGRRTDLGLDDIAKTYNPVLRGWLEYYGRYPPTAMHPVLRHFNKTLIAWALRKHKQLRGSKTRAIKLMVEYQRNNRNYLHTGNEEW